ncbi:hypothetical protein ONS95_005936 [Cadophora gregata]|uniref:uncharacterized protein n=1 Tax=Cadophora gregata TaxID=51156 RepID=UPI0026DD7CB0|nr:uncharacterized protein ONS95_005936 [Cadophora gregata]KAK0102313.1 hypothetical protein ONS95_005936 [Cadophora gregata]KAK0103942.1 hypothetical protein ONS96_005048 [Cadophora gregata f. sp. sojae]
MTFVLPSAATTEHPVVTSNSPVKKVHSPKPIRRVSFDKIQRLAGLMEVTSVPRPVTKTNTAVDNATATLTTVIRLVNSGNSNYIPPAAVNTTNTTTGIREKLTLTTVRPVLLNSNSKKYIPPPTSKITTSTVDRFFTNYSCSYYSSYNKNINKYPTSKYLRELLRGSVPDHSIGSRHGVIGPERTGRRTEVFGTEWA